MFLDRQKKLPRISQTWQVVLYITALLLGARSAMAQDQELLPSVDPHGEVISEHDPQFIAECEAAIADTRLEMGWRMGNSLLTISQQWGLVWRIDFLTRDQTDTRYVNRIICWKGDGNAGINIATAFGQEVPKLTANF
jgi:hypothetical protein